MSELSNVQIKAVGYIKSDFPEKFGIPRQSGLCQSLTSQIVFVPPFNSQAAFKGIEQFSHIWVIWGFSDSVCETFSPTVRPPKLGGNERIGVFASRSPFRPNPLGLSCVKLERVISSQGGVILEIAGADIKNGTPVYDVKPYIPYADCITAATGGFAQQHSADRLTVSIPPDLLQLIPTQKRKSLCEVLSLDPRPAYQDDPQRCYGFYFADLEVTFRVQGAVLTVTDIKKRTPAKS